MPLRGHDQRMLHVLQSRIAVERDIVLEVLGQQRNMGVRPCRFAIQLEANVDEGRSILNIIGDDAVYPDGGA